MEKTRWTQQKYFHQPSYSDMIENRAYFCIQIRFLFKFTSLTYLKKDSCLSRQTKKYSAAIVFTRMPCEVFIKSPHEVCNFFKLSLSKKGNYLTFFSPLPLFKLSFSYLLPPSSRTTWLKTRQATFWIEAGIALLTLLFLLLRLMPDTGFNITGGTEIPQCIFASQK